MKYILKYPIYYTGLIILSICITIIYIIVFILRFIWDFNTRFLNIKIHEGNYIDTLKLFWQE